MPGDVNSIHIAQSPHYLRKMRTEDTPRATSKAKDSAEAAKRGFRIRAPTARSKVTNGLKLLPGYDGRSVWGRRFHDLCALHARDAGGIDALSEAQVSLIRRAAALEVTLENLELDMACGRDVDLHQYSRSAGHLRRILESVGIRRVAKDISPSLADIIAGHRSKAAAEPASASKPCAAQPIAAKGVSRMDARSALNDGAIPARKEAE